MRLKWRRVEKSVSHSALTTWWRIEVKTYIGRTTVIAESLEGQYGHAFSCHGGECIT